MICSPAGRREDVYVLFLFLFLLFLLKKMDTFLDKTSNFEFKCMHASSCYRLMLHAIQFHASKLVDQHASFVTSHVPPPPLQFLLHLLTGIEWFPWIPGCQWRERRQGMSPTSTPHPSNINKIYPFCFLFLKKKQQQLGTHTGYTVWIKVFKFSL